MANETRTHTLGRLVDRIEAGGDRPALVQMREEGAEEVSYARLSERVRDRASAVAARGIGAGAPVALMGSASVDWIVACLSLLRAGAVPVPLDTQLEAGDLEGVLADCEARWMLCDADSLARLEGLDHGARVALLERRDPGEKSDEDPERDAEHECFADWPAGDPSALPELHEEDRALLFYTSGTTGPPKGVPLAHRHLAYQIDVIREADLVRDDDRLLLPLPPHHVYPLVVGILAPLALRLPIVLPRSLTGPRLLRALDRGGATTIIGVPRIYEALLQGIDERIGRRSVLARGALRSAVAACTFAKRRLHVDAGRALLRPVRRRIGPRLRTLVSGGSALSPELAWRLEGLGFRVASGYGLTETAPLLTMNPPGSRRLSSAGRPVRGVEIRIDRTADPEAHEDGTGAEEGEILVRGPGVFAGYRNLDEETRKAFTEDGWFRTGDLGHIDDDGYLHISGRKSTLIVSASGEKIRTEAVEAHYARHEHIEEIGVLEEEDGLAAVVVPSSAAIAPDRDPDEAIRGALDEQGGSLPSHQRIARFVVSRSPLDRTRLGKLRRHRLRERYETLRDRGGEPDREAPVPVQEMSGPDQELLADDAARGVWDLLARRFSDHGLTPDTRPRMDLGIDSLGWLDLSVEIAERTGIELEEERIAEIESVRDLLRAVAEASPAGGEAKASPLEDPEAAIDGDRKRWLAPLPPTAARLARVVSGLNRALVRGALRLEVRGAEHVPDRGPAVIAANHASYLDPFAIAAALPEPVRERTFWGGWTGIAFRNALFRGISRLARAVPVDPDRATTSSLAFAAAALDRGGLLVWFPEGRRSESGALQAFRPGIGRLLEARDDVPVVPVHIEGTHQAWPVRRRLPRPGRVRVTFAPPEKPAALAERGEGERLRDRIASGLRARVREAARREA